MKKENHCALCGISVGDAMKAGIRFERFGGNYSECGLCQEKKYKGNVEPMRKGREK